MFNARQLTIFGNLLSHNYHKPSFQFQQIYTLSTSAGGTAFGVASDSALRTSTQQFILRRLINCASLSTNNQNCQNFATRSIKRRSFQRSNSCLTTPSLSSKIGNCCSSSSSSKSKSSENSDDHRIMSYFVIGVSGVTCGGKTTLTKLLQKSFPWSRVIHQDAYFYPDDYEGHLRIPEVENHVHYDIIQALDMNRMHRDVAAILDNPPNNGCINGMHNGNGITPNFEGLNWIPNFQELNMDLSKYASVPILILEGFMLFESETLYRECDVRFFLTLDEETCRARRTLRNFDPPDCPGYFEHCIWPGYQQHYKNFVENKDGIQTFSGKTNVHKLWKDGVDIVTHKMEDKFSYKLHMTKNGF